LDPSKLVDKYGTPLYFTKENATKIGGQTENRKIEVFEVLQHKYTKEQVDNSFHKLIDDRFSFIK
jgi:hypothetical protein